MAYELIHDSAELRKLIAENPNLPIVVLAGEEAASPEWCWTYCADIKCSIDEILDTKTPYDHEDGTLFTDRDDFSECVEEALYDLFYDGIGDESLASRVKSELEKYEPYWRKVIAIYATN